MNKEILEQVFPVVEKAKEGLLAAIEGLQTQCPLLIKELLWWEGVKWGLWAVLFTVAFVLGLLFWRRFCRWVFADNAVVFTAYAAILFIAAPVGALCCTVPLIKVIIAPRLFLLEYVMRLLGGGQ